MLRTLAAVALALLWMLTPAHAQDWRPAASQEQAARASFDALWAAADRNDADAAYALLGDGFRALMDRPAFGDSLARFTALSGPLLERRVMRTTWYKDPPNSPGPGVYAAYDIVARYANMDRFCGYVIVYQRDDAAPFVILRIEQNYIDNATAQQIAEGGGSVEDMWRHLAHTSCPGWEPSWAIPISGAAQPPA
ncbi:DUF4019 domain-containing protein [Terricaulis sp.]|uniref:DUF4019 domain-containing protein n=1 Tax=Terricaulis sp. TaxID=2768686 RepID=UPI003785025D